MPPRPPTELRKRELAKVANGNAGAVFRWWIICAVLFTTLALARNVSAATYGQLGPQLFSRVTQSSDAAPTNGAPQAMDGSTATYSLTADIAGSYWTAELGRPYLLTRIELVNRSGPAAVELAGLTLRLLNIDDQIVFQTGVTNPGAGGTWFVNLPTGLAARSLWIGLPGTQTNGGGDHRVGLAEVRLFGELTIPFSPDPFVASNPAKVYQSTDYSSSYPAPNAVDGDPLTFSHTLNYPDSYWMADLGGPYHLDRVEIVNRTDCCDERLAGLVLRVFDAASNSVVSAVLTDPGAGGTWTYVLPPNITGRYVRVGIENSQTTADGSYYVTLAEARVFSGATNLLLSGVPPATNNLASFKPSYMVRLTPQVPAATNANDDNSATETRTTTATVDAYWEVDLGATYALYGVRTIAASGIGSRMTNTTLRLYDEAHDSVQSQRLTGAPDVFDSDVNGPVLARYVRVGLEDKQTTTPGTLEWYIGMREVEVFGRPTNQVGILSFSSSARQVNAGQPVTLSWDVADIRHVDLYPGTGSVGASTAASGMGSLVVTPGNSTEYILIASNTTGVFSSAAAVAVGPDPLGVQISELVADNQYSLQDGNGDASDWIELRNRGNSPVNLGGYGLSDNPAVPMKWVFPSNSIAPHSTVIVFASGSGPSVDPGGFLHANFKLAKEGGAVVLTAPNGVTTVDSVPAYPALDTDLAYGRNLDGGWCFLEPTPGAVNLATNYSGWLQPVSFNHARGYYDTAFTLTISNSNAGATVYYSLDGSVPTLRYAGSLNISGTKAVRVLVARPGFKSPRIQTETFIFPDNVIASPVMQTAITQNPQYAPRLRPGLLALPAISLVIPGGQPNYDEVQGSLEILWPNGTNDVQVNCGLMRFGSSYEDFAKRSFRAVFRSIYGAAKLQAPLYNGFDRTVEAKTSFDELEFRSGSQDMVERGFYMAGPFVEDSMLDMGSLNPHTRFAHIYINGVYWGQYDIRETLVDSFLANYLGGAKEDYVDVKGNDNVGDDFVVGTPTPPNILPWTRVLSLDNSYAAVSPYLDVRSLIDFMLLWFYGNCESEYRTAGPLTAGSGFKFWIADADGFLSTGALGLDRTANTGPGGIFGALVSEGNSDFRTLMADRIYLHCFNGGALTPAATDARLAARMGEITNSLIVECARWGYRTPANWESAYATIRSNLFPARTTQLVSILRSRGLYPAFNPPVFNQYGGLVTNGFQPKLSAPSGTIYYTLDGSDPRLPGGGISPRALVWVPGAVTISQDTTLNARVLTAGGQWSALAQPRFLLAARRAPAARDLLVTEIQYHPGDDGNNEFIELWNAGTNLLDLSGVSLTNAVRFVFPPSLSLAPGAFILVAKSTAAFAGRYQTAGSPWYWPGITVAGQWTGSLDNSGETLTLMGSNGVALSSISYQPGGVWPTRADGQGSSLGLRAPPPASLTDQQFQAYVTDGRNWTASSLYDGSPGRFDSFAAAVRINEIMSHPVVGDDWVELFNPGDQSVDLTGCALTDKIAEPRRFVFTNTTVIAPGQYLVLTGTQLGFGLSQYGDDLSLLSVTGTNIIRFLDEQEFPAVQADETFGLFQRSDGVLDFTELRAATPGAPNALPRVGPVVFSEIMYAPAPGMSPYLELANITGVPVSLFDPEHPTNLWVINGVGNFGFPSGTVMAPGSALVVCATNPAAFRTQYGISNSVPVFGPWSGVLDTNGEPITLLRPDAPEADGTVPYYRVDHVTYGTSAPWPAAGAGLSLQKLPLAAYGNDPVYWRNGQTNGNPGVLSSNRPPVWSPQPDVWFPAGMALTIPLSANDPDFPWQTIGFRAAGLPAGFVLDPDPLGIFGVGMAPGDYPVTVIVSDDQNPPLTADLQFILHLTDPFSLQAQLQPGVVRLTFAAIPGQTYRVMYCTDLALGNWQVLQEFDNVPDNVVTATDLQPGGAVKRFYQVLWIR